MEEGLSQFCMKAGGGGGGGGGIKCGRWNPTPEQVKVLTDLFKAGLRTPSTDQIQRISSQLSCYGKIESKNVFYWFQNHKARERQRRSRKMISTKDEHKKLSAAFFREAEVVSAVDFVGQETAVKTLQLFPLKAYDAKLDEQEGGQARLVQNYGTKDTACSLFRDASIFSIATTNMATARDPLELCLSSL